QGAFDSGLSRNLNALGLLGQYSGQDISNRLNSAQNLNSDNLGAYNAQGGAASLVGSLSAGDLGRKADIANSLNSANATQNAQQLQAAGLAPTLANNDYTDLQNLLNVGGAQDAQSAAQIQDLLTRWQYGQQQPWNLLNNYSGLLTGYAGLGGQVSGTSSGTTKQPGQSMLPQLIGAGATLASAFSDKRLKENIVRVGTADNGIPLYMFNYVGEKQ